MVHYDNLINAEIISALSIHLTRLGWQWGQGPWKHFPYVQVSDVLCYTPIPITWNRVYKFWVRPELQHDVIRPTNPATTWRDIKS